MNGDALAVQPAAMSHPGRWLVLVRLVVGILILKGGIHKLSWSLLGGFFPVPVASERWVNFLPKKLAEFAAGNPIEWYASYLTNSAIPHAKVYAYLTAFGELGIGLGLVLGLLTGFASLMGIVMMVNYFLADQWMGPCQYGYHILLIASLFSSLMSRSGRLGLDGLLAGRTGRSIFLKFPFG